MRAQLTAAIATTRPTFTDPAAVTRLVLADLLDGEKRWRRSAPAARLVPSGQR